ncbi:transcriptional regulator, LacI family [Bacteroides luti]|uniref:Transcriptional regulator, LacI family n=1 Tax=Bacteroides luti TaxID=1297750 RepID=A0A1M5BC98_9BACE|nr:substrate-binding domain-containing protein [Bacteroides luti]SHF40144.1 transcriptional regulator, LacI family [Bacteroides luti]
MKSRVSIKTIAEQVGVSTALVSYVLNNKNENRINKDVAAKIRKTAKELNYQPNQIARSLKSQKTQTIGLIVADIANPFSSQIARIIEDEAKKNGYSVIFGSSDESEKKTHDLITLFVNRQVDGLIVAMPEHSEDQILYLKQTGIPFVLIDRYFPTIPANYVAIDNYNAAGKAIRHLLANGHRRVGIISYKTSLHHLNERVRGAVDLLKEEAMVGEVRIDHAQEDVIKAIDKFLAGDNPVDAIFATTNLLTIDGLKYINSLGLKIPDQLAVVGFDETDAFDLFYAPVTYVKQPMTALGQKSVKILLDAIESNGSIESAIFDTELIIRKSSVIPR